MTSVTAPRRPGQSQAPPQPLTEVPPASAEPVTAIEAAALTRDMLAFVGALVAYERFALTTFSTWA